jgi:hypothetical protein
VGFGVHKEVGQGLTGTGDAARIGVGLVMGRSQVVGKYYEVLYFTYEKNIMINDCPLDGFGRVSYSMDRCVITAVDSYSGVVDGVT